MPVVHVSTVIGWAALLVVPALAEAPPPSRPLAGVQTFAPPPSRPPPNERSELSTALCGDRGLRGEELPTIAEEGGCGVETPVRLESAAGVVLEPPAVLACETARALIAWLKDVAIPSFRDQGGGLQGLTVADAYSCRNRNRAAKGELSEHALGRAIDIGAFHLQDGSIVTVREGWNSPPWSKTLRDLHERSCGPFGTVLGPDSNPLHADHFHFDAEVRRSGPWCE